MFDIVVFDALLNKVCGDLLIIYSRLTRRQPVNLVKNFVAFPAYHVSGPIYKSLVSTPQKVGDIKRKNDAGAFGAIWWISLSWKNAHISVKYVAIILICLGTQLLQLPAQSLIGSPGTLLPRWLGRVVMHCAPDLTASECLSIFIFLSPLGSLAEILLINTLKFKNWDILGVEVQVPEEAIKNGSEMM